MNKKYFLFPLFKTQKIQVGVLILIALSAFYYKFSLHVLNPKNFDWLIANGDPGTEYISWLYFRQTPWVFPVIGTMSGYDYPTITGIGLTGAIPLLAIPFKICSPILPQGDFQYFGYWFLLCYVLQTMFGFRLLKSMALYYRLNISNWVLVVGTLFYIVAPPLLFRSYHMNLCAHWLILWGLCLYYEDDTLPINRLKSLLFLTILTALIHQYLLLMILGLGFALTLKLSKKHGAKLLLCNLINISATAFIWYLIGNFLTPLESMRNVGFGSWSANINTFFNNRGEGIFLKPLTDGEMQYEGMAYMGIGLIILGLIVLPSLFFIKPKTHDKQKDFAIWFVAILFTFFAFSNVIMFNKTLIYNAKWFMEVGFLNYLGHAFRASGRFIWVLFYLLMTHIIILFFKMPLKTQVKYSLFIILVAIQVIDIFPMMRRERKFYDYDGYEPYFMSHATWRDIFSECNRVVMIPNYVWHYKVINDFLAFAHETALLNKPITTGYLSRPDKLQQQQYSAQLEIDLKNADLKNETRSIFVCTKAYFNQLVPLLKNSKIKTFIFEDYIIGVPLELTQTIEKLNQLRGCSVYNEASEDMPEFLLRNKNNIILATIDEEGAYKLCDSAKTVLKTWGSHIDSLKFGGAYVGIFKNEKIAYEKINNQDSINVTLTKNYTDVQAPFQIQLRAGGPKLHAFSDIIINRVSYKKQFKRGFNFIVCDKKGKPIEFAFFDTYQNCYTGAVFKLK